MQSANQLIRTQDAGRESSKLSSAVHRRRARSYRLMRIVTGGGNSAERVLAAAAYDCPPRADDVYPAEARRPLNSLAAKLISSWESGSRSPTESPPVLTTMKI